MAYLVVSLILHFNQLFQVLSKYSKVLGAKQGQWVDVISLDEEFLQFIPQPVHAVILLFPISQGVSRVNPIIKNNIIMYPTR